MSLLHLSCSTSRHLNMSSCNSPKLAKLLLPSVSSWKVLPSLHHRQQRVNSKIVWYNNLFEMIQARKSSGGLDYKKNHRSHIGSLIAYMQQSIKSPMHMCEKLTGNKWTFVNLHERRWSQAETNTVTYGDRSAEEQNV